MNNLQGALRSHPNAEYTFKNPCRQLFDLPYPIIKYMIQNPTGAAWKKLIQTCKYFFSKNAVFPVRKISISAEQWVADGEHFNPEQAFPRLWLYDTFEVGYINANKTIVSSLIPKLFKCHVKIISIFCQSISWNDYKFLTSSGTFESLDFDWCSIKYPDGTDVTMDKLLENVQYLEKFENFGALFQPDTTKKLIKILPGIKNLHSFKLYALDESFDFASFIDFIMNNKSIDIYIGFITELKFSDGYKQILGESFAKIVANPLQMLPYIFCYGFRDDQYNAYQKFYLEMKNQ
uniref:Uncharacterized protein n=1 Tax=Panagrolaimus sp. ES5 TaxID=591445 RepID=A0AC34FGG4_9BILA